MDSLSGLAWVHADVFCDAPLGGNGLCVFRPDRPLDDDTMLRLTQEMRQFESIFLFAEGDRIRARIFTVEEELDFAGHPLLGAAAVLHDAEASPPERASWPFHLNSRSVDLATRRLGARFYEAAMDQGVPRWGREAEGAARAAVLEALGLAEADLVPGLPLAMVSTGLDYLIVPVTPAGLAKAAIRVDDFEARLDGLGAKFAYLLDTENAEGRTWDNLGAVEDVATGSAAGPAGAYLLRHCGAPLSITLRQGRFAGRPSRLSVTIDGESGAVTVGGGVAVLAEGRFY
ncbi:PhzF family phenazine biosynthesis protein [Pelagibius sp.]|uniref:PhzF family phenazine biosynthesis protein n=1 Tax=Pelagibius sp. TaxID=1931238 RepID=UPI003B508614